MTRSAPRADDRGLRGDASARELAGVLRARSPRAGGTRVVAVDGPSGAGKTTLAAQLSPLLERAPVLHMDDLYPGWDGLAAAVPRLVQEVLVPLAQGLPARYRRYDWERGAPAEQVPVPAAPWVVVEGAGCGSRACAPHLSALVWVEAPQELRRHRGLVRDGEAYRPHWERWAVQERALFAAERTRERADLRLETGSGRLRWARPG